MFKKINFFILLILPFFNVASDQRQPQDQNLFKSVQGAISQKKNKHRLIITCQLQDSIPVDFHDHLTFTYCEWNGALIAFYQKKIQTLGFWPECNGLSLDQVSAGYNERNVAKFEFPFEKIVLRALK